MHSVTHAASEPLTRELSRVLQTVHAAYTRSLGTALATTLDTPACTLISLDEIRAESLSQRCDPSGCRIPFASTRPDAGFLACDTRLALLLIARTLSAESYSDQEARPLSELETQLVRGALEPAVSVYAHAWKREVLLQALPDFAEEPPLRPEERLYVATYELRDHQVTGRCCIVLRLDAWRDLLAIAAGRLATHPPPPPNSALLATLGDCLLTTRAVLGATRITVGELLNLHEGDIICLDRSPDAPVEIRIGDRPKLLARAHVQHGQYVVTIEGGIPGEKA